MLEVELSQWQFIAFVDLSIVGRVGPPLASLSIRPHGLTKATIGVFPGSAACVSDGAIVITIPSWRVVLCRSSLPLHRLRFQGSSVVAISPGACSVSRDGYNDVGFIWNMAR